MSDDDAPPGGFYYTQAIWALAPRNLRKTYAKIYNDEHGREPPEEFAFPTFPPGSNLSGEFDAWNPIMEGFDRRRNAGKVIGFGHPDTAAAPQQEIPLNEWRHIRVDGAPSHSTFSGGGRIWYRVKFYTRQAVETWRRARRAADDDKGAKTETVKKRRRPSRGVEIDAAYQRLVNLDRIDFKGTLLAAGRLVCKEVMRSTGQQTPKGLGDEVIRKRIGKKFMREKRKRERDHER